MDVDDGLRAIGQVALVATGRVEDVMRVGVSRALNRLGIGCRGLLYGYRGRSADIREILPECLDRIETVSVVRGLALSHAEVGVTLGVKARARVLVAERVTGASSRTDLQSAHQWRAALNVPHRKCRASSLGVHGGIRHRQVAE